MAEHPPDLRDYADYASERTRTGRRLAARLSRELDPERPPRRSPVRLLYVTFPLAAAALAGAALVSSIAGRTVAPDAPVAAAPEVPEAPEAPPPAALAVADGLTVRAALDQGALLQGSGEDRFLVVEFAADDVTGRQPVHVSAVVDTSGSMAGDHKITFAREALLELARQLGPEDTLSVVGFDDEATVWLPTGPMGDTAGAFDAIAALSPGGGTKIGAGLAEGLAQLGRVERAGARRVVVLSDGISDEDTSALAALAGSRVEAGITVSAIGLGLDFDSRALVAISDAGGGRYGYVGRAEELPARFRAELDTLTRVASRGVALDVALAEGVQVRSVFGYEEHDGAIVDGGYRAFVGDMHGGQQRKVVARLHVPDDVPGDRAVASVSVRYTEPASGERRGVALAVGATVTSDAALVTASREPRAGVLAARAIQGATLERGREGFASGDAETAAAAFEEGDRMLSTLEGRFGPEVGDLRSRLSARASEFESLEQLNQLGYVAEPAAQEMRAMDLEAGVEALESMY
jgi:Ca-activated chloride channel homolog